VTVSAAARRTGLAAIVAVAAAGCTHFSPYVWPGMPPRVPAAPPVEVAQRLILIGDSGDPDPDGEPTLELLARRVRLLPDRTTVVFLGDNVYERGMPEPITPAEKPVDALADAVDVVLPDLFASRQEAERQLSMQVDALRGTTARGVFVTGNHDWDQFEPAGWLRVRALEHALKDAAADGTRVEMVPPGGCPGPTSVPIGTEAVVIALDSQWWLETRTGDKPSPENNPTACPYVTEDAVRDALIAQLKTAAREGRKAIVVAHHPLETMGPHGGFVDIRTHLFPMQIIRHYVPFYVEWIPIPVLGSAIVWFRQCCSPSVQDTSNRRNRRMRRNFQRAMTDAGKDAAPLLYAAGHDHSLQVFTGRRGPQWAVVSGLGSQSRASDVGDNRRTLFAHASPFHPGFMEVDFLTDGSVRLEVREVDGDQPEGVEAFSMWLADVRR
jgi:hypothetical protein